MTITERAYTSPIWYTPGPGARLHSLSTALMALNIRNAEVEELAEALARLTGETKTEAVRRALRDRLDAAAARAREAAARRRARRYRAGLRGAPVRDARTADEILGYDDHGVPR